MENFIFYAVFLSWLIMWLRGSPGLLLVKSKKTGGGGTAEIEKSQWLLAVNPIITSVALR